jgi:outer membrane lipoprotein-sorting protein
MRRTWIPIAAAALLAAVPLGAARAEDAPAMPAPGTSTWFTEALAYSEGGGMNITYFWSKGAKFRAETVIAGRRITTIVNGNTYWAYDSLGRGGVAIARGPKAIALDVHGQRPFGREFENLMSQGAERVREEDINGRKCEVFRLTDELGRRELWVTKDQKRLPVRVTVYRRDTGRTVNTDFLNWLTGLSIDDRFFEPESGLQLEQLAFDTYVKRTMAGESIGPVPVLYTDLLVGRSDSPASSTSR